MAEINPEHGKSNWLSGQQIDQIVGPIPFVQATIPYRDDGTRLTGYEGVEGADITPKNDSEAIVRLLDLDAQNAARDDFYKEGASKIDVQLPNELLSIAVAFNQSEGAGSDLFPVSQQDAASSGPSGSSTLSPRASSNGSASVQVSLQPKFKVFATRVNASRRRFFIFGDFTEADLITRLNSLSGDTILPWLVFNEVSETLTLHGQQVSVGAKADTNATVSRSGESESYAYQYGGGSSVEVSVTNTIMQLPPCIHGAITISPDSVDATAEAEAQANTIDLYIDGVLTIPAITNEIGPITETATASVTPASLSATSPASVPVTGLYLYDWQIQDSTDGYTYVIAFVVDASQFA